MISDAAVDDDGPDREKGERDDGSNVRGKTRG